MGRSTRMPACLAVMLLYAACARTPDAVTAGPDRASAWDGALTFVEFVAGDTASQDLWREHARRGAPADLVARMRGVGGEWKLLVLAESWCSDAVYAVPFLAALADSVPGLELRLLRTEGYDHLFAGHERNGRAAHPLVLILDHNGSERGAWVERPAELAAWIDVRRGVLPDDDLRLYRNGWYAGNGGRAALGEVVGLMDDVRSGRSPVTGPALASDGEREVTPCPAP